MALTRCLPDEYYLDVMEAIDLFVESYTILCSNVMGNAHLLLPSLNFDPGALDRNRETVD